MHGVPDIILEINNIRFDITIEAMTLLVMALLICMAFIISSKLDWIPKSKIQNVFEMIVEFLNKLAVDMIGPEGKKYVPLGGTIFLFVLLSNWMGLVPGGIFTWLSEFFPAKELDFIIGGNSVELNWTGIQITPPTGNINTPLALALVAVVYYNYCGIRKIGLKNYLLHHLGPTMELAREFKGPLLLLIPPLALLFLLINIVEHLSRAFSLTVRLFCNIMGEHSVIASLISVILILIVSKGVVPIFTIIVAPIPIVVMGIGILTGAVQALIFTLLTFSYISTMVAEHH